MRFNALALSLALLIGCGRQTREVRAAYAGGAPRSSQWEMRLPDGSWVAHGEFRQWSEEGKLLVAGSFAAGNQTGHWRQHHANGQLGSEGDFLDGKRSGAWVFCAADGVVLAEGHFRADQKQGPWIYRHANGKIKAHGSYLGGKRDGVWAESDESGRIDNEKSGVYEVDVRIAAWPVAGERVLWSDEARGIAKSREQLVDGVRHGLASTWYADGRKESEGTYELGQQSGEWRYFRPDGELDHEQSGIYERFVRKHPLPLGAVTEGN